MKHVFFALGAALATASPAWTQSDVRSSPIVVELFTSQGCGACPKANEVLGEIAAEEDDVIALALAVDYWDYLGWRDTFAMPDFVVRQRAYAMRLSHHGVYTPQVVVDGMLNAPGMKRYKVDAAIEKRRAADASGPSVDAWINGEGRLTANIGAHETPEQEADVWLMVYDEGAQDVLVEAGENEDKTVVHYNMVTRLERLGGWAGSSVSFGAEIAPGKSAAILVQVAEMGPILAAAIAATAEIDPSDALSN